MSHKKYDPFDDSFLNETLREKEELCRKKSKTWSKELFTALAAVTQSCMSMTVRGTSISSVPVATGYQYWIPNTLSIRKCQKYIREYISYRTLLGDMRTHANALISTAS